VVLGVLTPRSDAVGDQRFGGSCRLHLQGKISHHITTRHKNPEDHDLNLHRREDLKLCIS